MTEEMIGYQTRDIVNIEDYAMSIEGLTKQVQLIQQVMSNVMKKDEHYGIIPGTDKPTLLKPGAEKLCLTFRLSPNYEIIEKEREDTFIAYTVVCRLMHIPTGQHIASGIGSCNSRETKYRYRSENTGREVPKEYWKSRDPNLLGGPNCKPRKKDGSWVVYEQVENDNPWDLDNTLIKMACKRALVAATLNATAASDIFTQDVEDLPAEVLGDADHKPPVRPPQRKDTPAPQAGDKISDAQRKRLYAIAKETGYSDDEIKSYLLSRGIEHTADIKKDEYDELCEWAKGELIREPGEEG